jgi:hypothetical protein
MILLSLVFVSQSFWMLLFLIDALCNNYRTTCLGGLSFWVWPIFQFHDVLIYFLIQYILLDTDAIRLLLNNIFKTQIFTTIFQYI